jgi:hypothetical protein
MSDQPEPTQQSTAETIKEQEFLHALTGNLWQLGSMIRKDYPRRIDMLEKHSQVMTPLLKRLAILQKINEPKK